MASEAPQIDLDSLSMQQLQHLLATSRHTGRTGMADAVVQELRDRRSQPSAARSWMSVDFAALAPEPEAAGAPAAADTPSEHLAAPYGFGALRAVRDEGGLDALAAPRPRRRPRAARPPHRRARVAAVIGGAMALACAAVVAALEWGRDPSPIAPPAERMALRDPGAMGGEVLPRASAVLVLPLRGPIVSAAEQAIDPPDGVRAAPP